MNKKYLILIFLILLVSSIFRLAKVSREFLGNFGQRQVYEAWVVRNFVREGIDIFNAKMDVLDYEGEKISVLRDLPLVNCIVASLCRVTGQSIEFCGRLTCVLFYVMTFIVLFLWLRAYFEPRLLSTILFVFAFLPMSIVYSQSFILEPAALFFFCLGAVFLEKYCSKGNPVMLIIGSLAAGISFATRTQYCILIIPLLYIFYREKRSGIFKNKWFYISIFIMLAIPFLWQAAAWQAALARGTKSSLGVTAKTYAPALSTYFNPETYKKIFDDLTGIILNPVGFTLAVLGILIGRRDKYYTFFLIFAISVFLTCALMPLKFYRHDYYFFPVILPASIFIGYSIEKIAGLFTMRYSKVILLSVFLLASLRYAVNPAFKTPDDQKPYLSQAAVVRKMVPEKERIVFIGTDSTFVYYCDRMGWTLETNLKKDLKKTAAYVYSNGRMQDDPINLLRHYESKGAAYLVLYHPFTGSDIGALDAYISANYKIIEKTDFISVFKIKG